MTVCAIVSCPVQSQVKKLQLFEIFKNPPTQYFNASNYSKNQRAFVKKNKRCKDKEAKIKTTILGVRIRSFKLTKTSTTRSHVAECALCVLCALWVLITFIGVEHADNLNNFIPGYIISFFIIRLSIYQLIN